MANFRKLARDGVRTVLSAGFNAAYAALVGSVDYPEIEPIEIDWLGKQNLIEAFLLPDDVDLTQIKFRAHQSTLTSALVLYTSAAADPPARDDRQMFTKFSGDVAVHADFYVRTTSGAERADTESICDAIEDAVNEVMSDPVAPWPDHRVVYAFEYECARDPVQLKGDGWQQRIPMIFKCGVNL